MSRAHRFSKHVFFNYGPEEGTAQASEPEKDLGHPPAAARSYYWAMAQGRPCRRRTEHSKGTLAPVRSPSKGPTHPGQGCTVTGVQVTGWSPEQQPPSHAGLPQVTVGPNAPNKEPIHCKKVWKVITQAAGLGQPRLTSRRASLKVNVELSCTARLPLKASVVPCVLVSLLWLCPAAVQCPLATGTSRDWAQSLEQKADWLPAEVGPPHNPKRREGGC